MQIKTDEVLQGLETGRYSDADVLAMGYSRDEWLAYEVEHDAAQEIVLANPGRPSAAPAVRGRTSSLTPTDWTANRINMIAERSDR